MTAVGAGLGAGPPSLGSRVSPSSPHPPAYPSHLLGGQWEGQIGPLKAKVKGSDLSAS